MTSSRTANEPLPGLGRACLRPVLYYAAFAVLWIVFSDRLLAALIDDPVRLTQAQSAKGIAFVAATALLLYLLVRRELVEHARLADAMRAGDERFRLLVESIRDYAIFLLDPAGRVVSWNAGAERIKGYSAAEIVGRDFGCFYTAEDRAAGRPQRALALAAAEGRYAEEGVRVRKDGRRFEASVVITALRDGHGVLTGFVKVTHDITERKRAEQALRDSEERFRATFEQAAVGIAHVGPDGRWLRVNRRLCEIVGYSREELLARTFQDITHPDDLGTDLGSLRRMLTGEIASYATEKRYLRKDGAPVWINQTVALVREADGRPKYFISVVEDIGARREAQGQAAQRLAMLEALYAAARDLAASLEVATLCANLTRLCVERFGVRLAWVGLAEPGGGVRVHAHHPESSDYLAGLEVRWDETPQGQGPTGRAIRSHEPQVTADLLADAHFGPWRERAATHGFRTSAALPLLSRGQALGALNLYSDARGFFTPERIEFFQAFAGLAGAALENAALYARLNRHAEELEQRVTERTAELARSNAELESFAHIASHDLRAPLRAVQGFAQALLEDYGERLDDSGRDYLRRVTAAAEGMDRLIHDLLAYSRLGRGEVRLVPVGLDAVVREALGRLAADIAACTAQVSVAEPLPAVLGHHGMLVQIATNLIGNACKFVAPGTRAAVRVGAERRDGRVRLWVQDDGLGIAPEHRERIFRPFERLHGVEAYPGSGMGLAIVRKAAERMHGRVGLESEPGRGSRFWVELAPAPEPQP